MTAAFNPHTPPQTQLQLPLILQRTDSFAVISAQGRISQATIQLGHPQLHKGIPSFMLSSQEQVGDFVQGFLFRSAYIYWDKYSEILWSGLEPWPELPILFGAKVPDKYKHLVFQPTYSSTKIERLK